MKALMVALAVVALVIPQASAFSLISVSGVIWREEGVPDPYFHYQIKSETFNAAAIYKAFGVSARDYYLDCQPGGTNFLSLRPRYGADTNLPTIVLLENRAPLRALRDVPGPSLNELALSSPVTDTPLPLFDGFRGTAIGRIWASPTGPRRARYEVSGSSSTHIFKIRFETERNPSPGG